jgi:hypothetical protein
MPVTAEIRDLENSETVTSSLFFAAWRVEARQYIIDFFVRVCGQSQKETSCITFTQCGFLKASGWGNAGNT